MVPGLNGARPCGGLRRKGANVETGALGRESESRSDPVFGAGSLSAFIVLMTPGNAAQTDPVEGREAPLLQNRTCETPRGL